MLRPLFIDNDYQLLNSASGQIARNFWENQSDTDFMPKIVCTPSNFNFKSKWRTIEIEDRYWIWFLGVFLRKLGLSGLSYLPDMHYYSWAKFVSRNLAKTIENKDFDYIHTLSAPQSTHLIGLKMKMETGKPWVVQMNDPWHDDCDHSYKLKITSQVDLNYEQSVVKNADVIIHTNHILADMWSERYGDVVKNKMYVLPLNFNISNLPDIKEKNDTQLTKDVLKIAHIGEIYSTRSSVDFLKGLSQLLDEKPDFRKKIHVSFIGRVKDEDVELTNKLGLTDVIEYIPPMPPEKLNDYYVNTDIFLVIDVNQKRSPAFPSKLMMYHYYRKPILGITNPSSIIEEELNKTGHNVCYYGQPKKVAEFLYKAITDYHSINSFDKNYWKTYKVDNVTSLYKSILHEHKIL